MSSFDTDDDDNDDQAAQSDIDKGRFNQFDGARNKGIAYWEAARTTRTSAKKLPRPTEARKTRQRFKTRIIRKFVVI